MLIGGENTEWQCYGALMQIDTELADKLQALRTGHDIVPFFNRWLPSSEVEFRPLPDDMLAILLNSLDFSSVSPGNEPTTLQLVTDDAEAEIIVYRSVANSLYYILVPIQSLNDLYQ